jgi:hypothetical protein
MDPFLAPYIQPKDVNLPGYIFSSQITMILTKKNAPEPLKNRSPKSAEFYMSERQDLGNVFILGIRGLTTWKSPDV